ncbi:MAG TPA: hypothetical protein VJ440_11630 [Candidatus Brocadiaceae bacterium]|nr:hypothetical protein [Candidatus Brocadiaceae bacterium]
MLLTNLANNHLKHQVHDASIQAAQVSASCILICVCTIADYKTGADKQLNNKFTKVIF